VKVSGSTAKPDEDFDVELPWVSDAYLQTLGVPSVAGRMFRNSDTATSPKVAVVNQSFARHFFASPQAALGQHVSRPDRPNTDAVIVGVVGDVKHTSMRNPPRPTAYTLFLQAERPSNLTVYVRTWMAPELAANSIRSAVAGIDPKLILSDVSTMTEQIDTSLLTERTIAMLATTFGIAAALLSGIGLYGILAYTTTQRTREIGIRMALGARRGSVVRLILRETLMLAGLAVGASIPIAVLAALTVRNQLYGVSIADPAVYGIGILSISVVALLAGFLPACRAASVEPSKALRTD
jgi:predicted permease